jgi:antitoxin ParD1/3/4
LQKYFTTVRRSAVRQNSVATPILEPLKEFVDTQVAEGGYSTASEYVRALIREDQKRKVQEKLEALLLEGLENGNAKEPTAEDWAGIRRRVHERLPQRKASA